MANNYILQTKIGELQRNIFRSHDEYLCEGKSPSKIKLREILEGYIKEFISLVPHKEKFTHDRFAEVLKLSVRKSNEFSASDVVSAWEAISTYASNLFAEPWRTEYREIRLYSGYYTHRIKKHLHGAEALLELIGYQLVDNCKMILPGPPDPDNLTRTSLNALIAMCECQVLFTIYREVSKHLPRITYSDILSFRESCVCSEESAIRCILSSQCAPMSYCAECIYPYSVYPNNCCRKCIHASYMPTNGYLNYYSNNVPYHPPEPLPYTNGHSSNRIPTDKLIDLDEPLDTSLYKSWDCIDRPKHDRYLSSDSNLSYSDDYLRKTKRLSNERAQYRKSAEFLEKSKPERSRNSRGDLIDTFNQLNISPQSENSFYDELDGCKSNDKKNNDVSRSKSNRSKKTAKSAKNTKILWDCSKCTFRNSSTKDVCEVCGCSKNFIDEKPLISGGKQCPKCTLVNKKTATECAACADDLSGCSHYV